jgi:hypothetical protein
VGCDPANSAAACRGQSASSRSAVRRAAMTLACAACVAASAPGCASTASSTSAATPSSTASPGALVSVAVSGSAPVPTAVPASSDPGCARALTVVSTYGPIVLRNAVEAKETLDKAEIDLIVVALGAAADAAGDPAARQSVSNLASAYSRFRDAWTSATVPPIEAILADTSHLESRCRS